MNGPLSLNASVGNTWPLTLTKKGSRLALERRPAGIHAMEKIYLGDSVYAEFDGFGIWLTTKNGFGPSNKIYLEPDVLGNLNKFVEKLKKASDETV